MWENIKWCRIWATIDCLDANAKIFCISLGVFNTDIEVAIFIEYACIEKFILFAFALSTAININQISIGEFALRIFVNIFHVRMGGGII